MRDVGERSGNGADDRWKAPTGVLAAGEKASDPLNNATSAKATTVEICIINGKLVVGDDVELISCN